MKDSDLDSNCIGLTHRNYKITQLLLINSGLLTYVSVVILWE